MFSEADTKAICSLGWIPKYSLEKALIETITKYKESVVL
jgi:nucleoside-diphosphate-sugar epimerase